MIDETPHSPADGPPADRTRVVARTPFHNSTNGRTVVVRGTATAIDDPDEHP